MGTKLIKRIHTAVLFGHRGKNRIQMGQGPGTSSAKCGLIPSTHVNEASQKNWFSWIKRQNQLKFSMFWFKFKITISLYYTIRNNLRLFHLFKLFPNETITLDSCGQIRYWWRNRMVWMTINSNVLAF